MASKFNTHSLVAFGLCVAASVICYVTGQHDGAVAFGSFAAGIAALPQLTRKVSR